MALGVINLIIELPFGNLCDASEKKIIDIYIKNKVEEKMHASLWPNFHRKDNFLFVGFAEKVWTLLIRTCLSK